MTGDGVGLLVSSGTLIDRACSAEVVYRISLVLLGYRADRQECTVEKEEMKMIMSNVIRYGMTGR